MFVLENIHNFINESFEYLSCDEVEKDLVSLFKANIDDSDANSHVFAEKMAKAKASLKKDLKFFYESDPATDSIEEIILAYPGYLAIAYYRLAHILYELDYKLSARIISETAHKITGIDIHPGAKIDCPFFIDHGTGIVIGETSIIGKRVKIYQGVTLGALSLKRGHDMQNVKRHPTIGNDVTIYAGVSILGDVKVGDNVTFGSNVFITEDVPNNVKVVILKPQLIVKHK